MERCFHISPSFLYISSDFSRNSRIFSTTGSGERIFTFLPKVAIQAKKGGLISMGARMIKWFSSHGIIIIFLPNWSITASANSLRKRMRTLYS